MMLLTILAFLAVIGPVLPLRDHVTEIVRTEAIKGAGMPAAKATLALVTKLVTDLMYVLVDPRVQFGAAAR